MADEVIHPDPPHSSYILSKHLKQNPSISHNL
jgi:hypothetical protein